MPLQPNHSAISARTSGILTDTSVIKDPGLLIFISSGEEALGICYPSMADNSADIIISNCVINLSTEKSRVFEEIFRVLKPGGRISISDIALTEELPSPIKESEQAYVGCIAGALLIDDYEQIVKDQGFKDVEIVTHDSSTCIASFTNDPVAKDLLAALKNYETDVTEKLNC